jgi:hypothetical protein
MMPPVDPAIPLGERIASLARALLAEGPLGPANRHELSKEFLAAGRTGSPHENLWRVKTTCGITVRALHIWCGRPYWAPTIGGALVGGWVDLTTRHASWQRPSVGALPSPGDCFYVDHRPAGKLGHVGTFTRKLDEAVGGEVWETAEGGGSPGGTTARLGRRTVGPGWSDVLGRQLVGWWRVGELPHGAPLAQPEQLGLGTRDTDPAPPPSTGRGQGGQTPGPASTPGSLSPLPPTLRRGAQGMHVRELQAGIGLPVAARDGIFGAGTEAGLIDWQRLHGLAPDGVAGPRTWEAIRAR